MERDLEERGDIEEKMDRVEEELQHQNVLTEEQERLSQINRFNLMAIKRDDLEELKAYCIECSRY